VGSSPTRLTKPRIRGPCLSLRNLPGMQALQRRRSVTQCTPSQGGDRDPSFMSGTAFLQARYDLGYVFGSGLLASLVSYVALEVSKRVRDPDRVWSWIWMIGGAIVMGTGIWAMHFVGMLGLVLPIELGYLPSWTLYSWLAAVGASGVALNIASRGQLRARSLLSGSALMATGICAMHYMGMHALDMQPAIVWNPVLVAISAAIAATASAAALVLMFRMREANSGIAVVYQVLAAVVMGMAISGMHFTGMAAAGFPVGAICAGASSLAGGDVAEFVIEATVGIMAATLVASTLQARERLARSLGRANDRLQQANEALQKQAFVDPLTGLANRALLEERISLAVARQHEAAREAEKAGAGADAAPRFALLMVDLDGFKPVNDSYGHAAGDEVLCEIANRLRMLVRGDDTLARLGGDEFVVLADGMQGEQDCIELARRVLKAISQPFHLHGDMVSLCGSVGIVLYPDHGDHEKLVAHADAAMYSAKRAGGNTSALFEPRMDVRAQEQLALRTELRNAIEAGELRLYYQPKVQGDADRISGVEGLIRWQHPVRGLLGPAEFIPIAERFGLITALGNWVIDEACRQVAAWDEQGLSIHVAVNLSVHQLRDPDLVLNVEQALTRHHVAPGRLLCEITESVAMEDFRAVQRAFDGLARIGVYLAIDDFGTGYSSLAYLRQLPARQLKIDRSFVSDLEWSPDALAVVDAVIRLAHALGLKVVAEGVENAGQREILRNLHCDELQGFLFARPMPAGQIPEWAAAHALPDVQTNEVKSLASLPDATARTRRWAIRASGTQA
jgi:diguanylate cyclase